MNIPSRLGLMWYFHNHVIIHCFGIAFFDVINFYGCFFLFPLAYRYYLTVHHASNWHLMCDIYILVCFLDLVWSLLFRFVVCNMWDFALPDFWYKYIQFILSKRPLSGFALGELSVLKSYNQQSYFYWSRLILDLKITMSAFFWIYYSDRLRFHLCWYCLIIQLL